MNQREEKISFEDAGFEGIDQNDLMNMRWQPDKPLINFYKDVTRRKPKQDGGVAYFVAVKDQEPMLSDQHARDIITVLRSVLHPSMSLSKIMDAPSSELIKDTHNAVWDYLAEHCHECSYSQKNIIMSSVRNIVYPQIKRSVNGFEARNSRSNLIERRDDQTATITNENGGGFSMPFGKSKQRGEQQW